MRYWLVVLVVAFAVSRNTIAEVVQSKSGGFNVEPLAKLDNPGAWSSCPTAGC